MKDLGSRPRVRSLVSAGAGVLLVAGLVGCAGGSSNEAACGVGEDALNRLGAASSVPTSSEEGLSQTFVVMEDVAAELRRSGAEGDLAGAHEELATAIEGYVSAGRDFVAGSGSEGAVDAAQVKMLDAGGRVDGICN